MSHDVIITEKDCGTFDGIVVTPLMEGGEVVEPIGDRILGRVALDDIRDPYTQEIIVEADQEIDEELVRRIEDVGIERVKIRSVLSCRAKSGVCSFCYGRDLGTGKIVNMGEAVGVIAAQSIGEPGTQLTMRTFHIGGTASRRAEQTTIDATISGKVNFSNLKTVRGSDGRLVVMNRNGQLVIEGEGRREPHSIIYGAKLNVENEKFIEPNTRIAEWDPYTVPILTDVPGTVRFKDITEGVTMKETVDQVSQKATKVIVESKGQDLQPQIVITPPALALTVSPDGGVKHIQEEEIDLDQEVATDLNGLPEGFSIPTELEGNIFYDAVEKLLVLRGVLGEEQYDILHALSSDAPYRKAIATLFARGRDRVESIVGYGCKLFLSDPQLLLKIAHVDDQEKLTSFLNDSGQKMLDELRLMHRRGHSFEYALEKVGTSDDGDIHLILRPNERNFFIPVGANILEVQKIDYEEREVDGRTRKIFATDGRTIDGALKKTEELFIEGDPIAKIPRETTKTKDITGGLPRVAELFEARKPKEVALISEIDGTVSFGKDVKGKRKVVVTPDVGESREYLIPRGKHISVHNSDKIKAGEVLMDGSPDPSDILNVKGEQELAKYLVDEVQEVYRLQGVKINDKHIEIIVRQMLKRIRIKDEVGDTKFLVGEQVSKMAFEEENARVVQKGGKPAHGEPLLLGITKASLNTDSFISAASFQETTKVLTQAAIEGSTDLLLGLKENAIMDD